MIAAEGHLTTEAVMWNQNRFQKTISGMVIEFFIFVVSMIARFLVSRRYLI